MTLVNEVQLIHRFYVFRTMLIISDSNMFGVSVSTASLVIKKVSYAIAGIRNLYVTTPDDLSKTKLKLFGISRFPIAFGADDCTHIRIQSPGNDNAEI